MTKTTGASRRTGSTKRTGATKKTVTTKQAPSTAVVLPKGARTTMGIDLGDRESVVCSFDPGTGEVTGPRRISMEPKDLEAFFADTPAVRVVMETGTHSN